MSLDLDSPLRDLKGIGPSRERQFAAEGVRRVGDLLAHLPARYEDRRRIVPVGAIDSEGDYTLSGRLVDVRLALRRGRRFSLVRGRFEDESGDLPVVWFNRPYLARQVDPEASYLVHGRVRQRGKSLELQNPSCERLSTALHSGRIVPVYPALGPLGPALLRRLLGELTAGRDLAGEIADPLPRRLLERHSLPPLGEALQSLHRPAADADLERLERRETAAHRRLIYGELLAFQLRLTRARRRGAAEVKTHRIEIAGSVDELAGPILPFELTTAQRRVVAEILADLESPRPMRRLLQGDVGSGKTAVAAVAFAATIGAGLQGAFMAPTELLAEQHHATLESYLGKRYRLALVTGSTRDERLYRDLREGRIDLAVGTQALIQEGLAFRRLALAVVDEQHRFGVSQRSDLGAKGLRPDLLVMTATPIPRTLTLTAYGDLDLSIIDELPPGRRGVETIVAGAGRRDEVLERVAAELDRGGRAYVVFPTIRPRPGAPGQSLEEGRRVLARGLPEARVAIVHGGTPVAERLSIMAEFARGGCQVLLATTVIEVGVDVPEATVMVIEGAERFGLAQLHQLRGRVGRGEAASRCFALHGRLTDEARARLEIFAATQDGFEIAEADLAIRGPGELLGKRQAGLPRFRVADLVADAELLELARRDARELLEAGEAPGLETSAGAPRAAGGDGERLARA